jgi:hypothetical protein
VYNFQENAHYQTLMSQWTWASLAWLVVILITNKIYTLRRWVQESRLLEIIVGLGLEEDIQEQFDSERFVPERAGYRRRHWHGITPMRLNYAVWGFILVMFLLTLWPVVKRIVAVEVHYYVEAYANDYKELDEFMTSAARKGH